MRLEAQDEHIEDGIHVLVDAPVATEDITDGDSHITSIIDIQKYSVYHSYYKHLALEGSQHIVLPKLYGHHDVHEYGNEILKYRNTDLETEFRENCVELFIYIKLLCNERL